MVLIRFYAKYKNNKYLLKICYFCCLKNHLIWLI